MYNWFVVCGVGYRVESATGVDINVSWFDAIYFTQNGILVLFLGEMAEMWKRMVNEIMKKGFWGEERHRFFLTHLVWRYVVCMYACMYLLYDDDDT